jgi:hypothetical protein
MATRHFHAASPGAIIRFIFRKCLDFGVEADQPGVESIDLIVKTALRSYVFQQLVLVGGFLIGNRGETVHRLANLPILFAQLTQALSLLRAGQAQRGRQGHGSNRTTLHCLFPPHLPYLVPIVTSNTQ